MLHLVDARQMVLELAVSRGAGGYVLLHQHLLQVIKCVRGRIDLRVAEKDMGVALGGQPALQRLGEIAARGLEVQLFRRALRF